ncbi:YkvA family protein [Deinococcus sp. SM5_A1]|uniref:YkvA family protein n=1 Tax=Deinococcus sp. SM5_A1 TaxID=3379094 RepID=UPI00385CDEE8
MITRLKPIWRDALALLFAVWDARTPMTARLGALLALAYALSPIDLIPDAIPVVGLGDDLLVVPAILALAARSLPAPVLFSARARSAALQRRLPWLLPALGASLILGLVLLIWGLWRGLSGN